MAPGTRPSSSPCDLKAPALAQSAFPVVNVARSSSDSTDYGFTAAHAHSFMHDDFDRRRHQQICSRSEFYHPKTFPAFYSLALPLPTNDAAGQDPGYLGAPDGHFTALDCQAVLLVQQPRVFLRGHQEFALLVSYINDFTV